MKLFCKFPTINKLNFSLVICIAKHFIWTTLKAIFFAASDSRFSNSCISAKFDKKNLIFKKLTHMTGFVVQGHMLDFFSHNKHRVHICKAMLCPLQLNDRDG